MKCIIYIQSIVVIWAYARVFLVCGSVFSYSGNATSIHAIPENAAGIYPGWQSDHGVTACTRHLLRFNRHNFVEICSF